MGKKKAATSGFSGRTIGNMLQKAGSPGSKSGGSAAPSKSNKRKKK